MAKGQHLHRFGQLDSAIDLLKTSTKTFTNSEQYLILGDYYLQKRNVDSAIFYYTTALYLVPNRFKPRKRLADLYNSIADTTNEAYWLKSIINLKAKVPTEEIIILKNGVSNRLKTIASKRI